MNLRFNRHNMKYELFRIADGSEKVVCSFTLECLEDMVEVGKNIDSSGYKYDWIIEKNDFNDPEEEEYRVRCHRTENDMLTVIKSICRSLGVSENFYYCPELPLDVYKFIIDRKAEAKANSEAITLEKDFEIETDVALDKKVVRKDEVKENTTIDLCDSCYFECSDGCSADPDGGVSERTHTYGVGTTKCSDYRVKEGLEESETSLLEEYSKRHLCRTCGYDHEDVCYGDVDHGGIMINGKVKECSSYRVKKS